MRTVVMVAATAAAIWFSPSFAHAAPAPAHTAPAPARAAVECQDSDREGEAVIAWDYGLQEAREDADGEDGVDAADTVCRPHSKK